jgi:uncharacterized protein (DUF58 family)
VSDTPVRPVAGVVPVVAKAAQLRRLELMVTIRLDGMLRGEFLGVRPGPGGETAGTRTYDAGDDARRIDWNLSARSLSPQLRTTDADRELHTWVIVDRSPSMDFGTAKCEKRDLAFAAVAAFGFLTARNGNRFGILVAGGDRIARLGPTTTRSALLASLSRLYDFERNESAPEAGVTVHGALLSLERTRPRRGQIVVISDFLDDQSWQAPMRRLSVNHQVLAVQTVDPRELTLPAIGIAAFVDPETGRRIHVQTNAASLRNRYETAARERQDAIAGAIRAAGADHLVLGTDRDWLTDIVKFSAGRRATRRRARGGQTLGTRNAVASRSHLHAVGVGPEEQSP